MLGAVLGDIIGSVYEWHNVKSEDIPLFIPESHYTDDTILTVAIGALLIEKKKENGCIEYFTEEECATWLKQYYSRYKDAGFGQMFIKWANAKELYRQKSYGNGAAMRVSSIGLAYPDLESVLKMAKRSCRYTHNHREAKKGAQAVASAIFLARKKETKKEIKKFLEKKFHYDFKSLDEIRPSYKFDSRAGYSVPPAIEAFLESSSYETAILKAISIGGDSDTIACIAGGIAYAYYKSIPEEMINRGMGFLDAGLRKTIREFDKMFPLN